MWTSIRAAASRAVGYVWVSEWAAASLVPPVLKLILFVVPLGLDTFAVSAALGMRGLPPRARLRVSLLMSSFEMAMPVVGLLVGHGLGKLVGTASDYVAIGVLAVLGTWMLVHEDAAESEKVAFVSRVPCSDGSDKVLPPTSSCAPSSELE